MSARLGARLPASTNWPDPRPYQERAERLEVEFKTRLIGRRWKLENAGKEQQHAAAD